MAKKEKVELDTALSKSSGTGGSTGWRQNQKKLRSEVPMNKSWDGTQVTPNFDGMCNGFKGRGLIFDSSDSRADRLTHVKHEIAEYIGKEYTNGK